MVLEFAGTDAAAVFCREITNDLAKTLPIQL